MRQRIHQRISPSSLQEAEGIPPSPVGGRACAQDLSPASGALGTPYFDPLCTLLWGAPAEGLKLGPVPHPKVTGPGFRPCPPPLCPAPCPQLLAKTLTPCFHFWAPVEG